MGLALPAMERQAAVRRWSRITDRLGHLGSRTPLFLKVAAPLMLLTAVLASTTGGIIQGIVQSKIQAAYEQETKAIAAGVEVMFLQHPDDTQQMDDYLSRLLVTRPDLVSVRIHGLDAQGTVIASSNSTEVGSTGLLDATELQAVWNGRPTQEMERNQDQVNVIPLKDQGFLFGAVVVTSSQANELAASGGITAAIAAAAVGSIVFELVVVMALLYFAMVRRTRRIHRAVAAVEHGDMTVRLAEGQEPPGRDEIFNLARQVDHMIASIDRRRRQDAVIRRLGQRALEGTQASQLVREGLDATRDVLGLERCIFANVSETGSVVSSIDDSGAGLSKRDLPLWVGALTTVAVAARKPVLTDRLGQASRFAGGDLDSTAQAVIVPLPRNSKAGEAIIAIAQAGQSIEAGGLAVLDAVAATIAETLHMQEAEEARAESAVKSRVMAAVSHEMRNPLNSILGFTALVLANPKEALSEKQRRQLGYVQTSATNMLNLVNNYLDLAKTRSGSLQIQPENVNVGLVVDEIVTSMQPLATKKNVTIRSAVDATGTARLDPTRIRQVLTNLLSNAVKFTPDAGQVFVRARVDAQTCRIVVSDTGVGITKEHRALVFTEFAKISAGALSGAKGTGLGLALTKAIVEAMGGTIRFYSRPGRGTTFVVVLPVSGVARSAAA